ncbi:hypothetical protein PCASD_12868 [Puccinia coronata f. sp. avenae]|uniref:Uncharacterized protein n=1 Tax=Puccinia coronata f. sp. avenae TaxID=200324 RepID=A0A2N5T8U4_9BASI|nr:hypothetical protein PCASD_12868 [Puccinia coronata f. sp. avenae]
MHVAQLVNSLSFLLAQQLTGYRENEGTTQTAGYASDAAVVPATSKPLIAISMSDSGGTSPAGATRKGRGGRGPDTVDGRKAWPDAPATHSNTRNAPRPASKPVRLRPPKLLA